MEKKRSSDRKKRRSIRKKLMVGVLLLLAIVMLSVSIVSLLFIRDNFIEFQVKEAKDIAVILANKIDGEKAFTVQKEKGNSSDTYREIATEMRSYLTAEEILYAYIVYQDDQGYHFLIDSDEDDPVEVGEKLDVYEDMLPAFQGEASADRKITRDQWGTFLSGYAPLYSKDGEILGIIGVDCDASQIRKKLGNYQRILIFLILILAVVMGVAAIFFVTGITSNIRKVVSRLEEIVHADGDLTKKLEMKSGDEMEEVSDLFNEFQEMVRNVIVQVNVNTEIIRDISDSITRQMKEQSMQIGSTDEQINSIRLMINETSGTMHGIQKTVRNTYGLTEEIHVQAESGKENLMQISNKASQIMSRTTEMEIQANELVQEYSQALEEGLDKSQRVQEVEDLSETIIGIANQSNLLALNASIEAARAGESGKGFVVVADQIAEMSQKTKMAAEKIAGLSSYILNAVSDLETTSRKLMTYIQNDILKDYRQYAKDSESYLEDAKQVLEYMNQFNTNARKLEEQMEKIQKSLSLTDEQIVQSEENVTDVSGFLQDVKENSERIRNMLEMNQEAMEELNEVVARFKTNSAGKTLSSLSGEK